MFPRFAFFLLKRSVTTKRILSYRFTRSLFALRPFVLSIYLSKFRDVSLISMRLQVIYILTGWQALTPVWFSHVAYFLFCNGLKKKETCISWEDILFLKRQNTPIFEIDVHQEFWSRFSKTVEALWSFASSDVNKSYETLHRFHQHFVKRLIQLQTKAMKPAYG